jgi:hypothetical protein
MTTRPLMTALPLLILGASTQAARAQITRPSDAASGADTVHVAKPTGGRDADRASIVAALGKVQPGGTIQFERQYFTR